MALLIASPRRWAGTKISKCKWLTEKPLKSDNSHRPLYLSSDCVSYVCATIGEPSADQTLNQWQLAASTVPSLDSFAPFAPPNPQKYSDGCDNLVRSPAITSSSHRVSRLENLDHSSLRHVPPAPKGFKRLRTSVPFWSDGRFRPKHIRWLLVALFYIKKNREAMRNH
jgi:hypothetical protein